MLAFVRKDFQSWQKPSGSGHFAGGTQVLVARKDEASVKPLAATQKKAQVGASSYPNHDVWAWATGVSNHIADPDTLDEVKNVQSTDYSISTVGGGDRRHHE